MKSFKGSYLQEFSFDNFVTGLSNQAGLEAARTFLSGSRTKQALLIWGVPGVGKSHLAGAIGNEILRRDPSVRIQVMWPEMGFRSGWVAPECDLLIVDGADVFSCDAEVWSEFIRSLDRLATSVILTTVDQPTSTQRLNMIEIGLPDLHHRQAIVDFVSRKFPPLSKERLRAIAGNSVTPREIEYKLIELDAQRSLTV